MPGVRDQLRIAFFGSDAFSVFSLRKLLQVKQKSPSCIAAIDVYTRSIKPTGRSLKQLIDVPIGAYAKRHHVPVFRVDTSQQIMDSALPRNYDLAIAVSFGKLIPGGFLTSLPYGGLNVHPSVLPKFSGSSPIQYALINDCSTTGVTVQTLHPTKFDCGDLIAQATDVPIHYDDNFTSLQEKLGVIGADLLAQVVSTGSFASPKPLTNDVSHSLAPKLTSACHTVKWNAMTSRQIKRLFDALGSLSTHKEVRVKRKKKAVQERHKVILQGVREASDVSASIASAVSVPGDFALCGDDLIVKTLDGFIRVASLKMQCCSLEPATQFVANLKKRCGDTENTFSTYS